MRPHCVDYYILQGQLTRNWKKGSYGLISFKVFRPQPVTLEMLRYNLHLAGSLAVTISSKLRQCTGTVAAFLPKPESSGYSDNHAPSRPCQCSNGRLRAHGTLVVTRTRSRPLYRARAPRANRARPAMELTPAASALTVFEARLVPLDLPASVVEALPVLMGAYDGPEEALPAVLQSAWVAGTTLSVHRLG